MVYLSNLLRAQDHIIPMASKESQAKYILDYSYGSQRKTILNKYRAQAC